MDKRALKVFPIFILIIISSIMIHNIYSHPIKWSYDYKIHMDAFQMNAESSDWSIKMPAGLEYNPPLYYWSIGKLYKFWSIPFDVELHIFVKFINFIFFLLIYCFMIFFVVPSLTENRIIIGIFSLLMGIIPNIYLSLVMPRADHLFFFMVNLIFGILVMKGLDGSRISYTTIFTFGLLLVVMANTRHIAGAAWGIFFLFLIYGVWKALKTESGYLKKIAFIVLIMLVFGLSGKFYYTNYLPEILGKKKEFSPEDKWIELYHAKYRKLGERMGVAGKLRMFGNLRFDKLLDKPNRRANFSDINTIKEFDFNFFRNKILYKIDVPEDRKLLLSFYKKDFAKNSYVMRKSVAGEQLTECRSLLFGVLTLQNAFWPRLYGDKWGDHWLYFSGKRGTEGKALFKKIVFLLGAPFSLFYFGLPLYYLIQWVIKLFRRGNVHYANLAGLLFIMGLLTLMAFVWMDPESGKNSTIKFTYIIGYSIFPFFCIIKALCNRQSFAKFGFIYLLVLFITVIPLNIFWI